ncbi:hypothetical protein [Pseudomonas sp. BNK-44-a]|uniref:hypothetical protein n=1 Tax=Pseudomonas sp. BNK-44-a TaxID=3376178 RepID=UPI0039BF8451
MRTAVLGAQAQPGLPFERLVEPWRRGDAGVNPLFQVVASAANGASALRLPGLHIEGLDVRTVTAQPT